MHVDASTHMAKLCPNLCKQSPRGPSDLEVCTLIAWFAFRKWIQGAGLQNPWEQTWGSLGRELQDPRVSNMVLKESMSPSGMPCWLCGPLVLWREMFHRMVRPGHLKQETSRAEVPLTLREVLLSYQNVLPNSILFPFPHLLNHFLRSNLLFKNPVTFRWAQDSTVETKVSWVTDGRKLEPNLSG